MAEAPPPLPEKAAEEDDDVWRANYGIQCRNEECKAVFRPLRPGQLLCIDCDQNWCQRIMGPEDPIVHCMDNLYDHLQVVKIPLFHVPAPVEKVPLL